MSLAAIRNGLFTTLTSCGPYDATQISTCAFDVLESSSACAVTFFAGKNTTFEEMTFGKSATDIRHWAIEGSVWVKSTGNVENILAATWQAHDDLFSTIKKDRTLAGTAQNAHVISMSYDPETAYDAQGATWQRIFWTLTAEEYDAVAGVTTTPITNAIGYVLLETAQAGQRISELTAASSVGSADLIPIVQSGVNKSATLATIGLNITAGKTLTVGDNSYINQDVRIASNPEFRTLVIRGNYPTSVASLDLKADENFLARAFIRSGTVNSPATEGSITFATGNNPVVAIDSGDNNDLTFRSDGKIALTAGGIYTFLSQPGIDGLMGVGVGSPTARLHLPAAQAAANLAPLKIDAGVIATSPISGNIESNGTHLYWTDSSNVRHQLDN